LPKNNPAGGYCNSNQEQTDDNANNPFRAGFHRLSTSAKKSLPDGGFLYYSINLLRMYEENMNFQKKYFSQMRSKQANVLRV
jgi:hypothetical protein